MIYVLHVHMNTQLPTGNLHHDDLIQTQMQVNLQKTMNTLIT